MRFCRRTDFTTSAKNTGTSSGISYDVNRRAAVAATMMGASRETLVKFSAAFDMHPPPLRDSWNRHLVSINNGLTGVRYTIQQFDFLTTDLIYRSLANLSTLRCRTIGGRTTLARTTLQMSEFRSTELGHVVVTRLITAFKPSFCMTWEQSSI